MISKAILLVGGKGTRLAPLTNTTPKPMLKVAGKSVTEHPIVKAREAGIKEIVLATSYLAEVFEPHFGDGSAFGISITYAVEREPLGTGGAIANAAAALELEIDESIFIFNGDVLSGHDLNSQANLHVSKNADVTLHLVEVEDARAYGCVPIDEEQRVQDFLEKMDNPVAKTINAGCYIFSQRTIATIPRDTVISVERQTFPSLLSSGATVLGYQDSRYWIDMGTPQSMIQASRDLILQPEISRATPSPQDASLLAQGVVVDPSSIVDGGSYIDADTVIGARCRISGSIIGEKSEIGSDVTIIDSYIAPRSRVKSGSHLKGEIFGF